MGPPAERSAGGQPGSVTPYTRAAFRDGDVLLSVGDYVGRLGTLAGPLLEEVTIVGQPGYRLRTDTTVEYLWRTPDKTWADLTITGSLSHPEVKPDLQVKLESLLGNDIEDKAKDLINTFKGLKGLFK